MRVCVVGKGGAGKSMVAGTMARLVAQSGERVLAFDADPMPSGMARSLGTHDTPEPLLADAVERKDGGPWRLKSGIGPVTAVRRYAREAPDGVLRFERSDGLEVVTWRRQGHTCVMSSKDVSRAQLLKLAGWKRWAGGERPG